jgi:hypothetical protein
LILQATNPNQGNADVVNLSIEALKLDVGSGKYCPHDFVEVRDAIELALGWGAILVAGAGNDAIEGCPNGTPPYQAYPAAYPGVIAVSGTTMADTYVETNNFGAFVDIAAPAENILAPYPVAPFYFTFAGTSSAAPQVSALATLILAVDNGAAVESIIKSTAEKVDVAHHEYVNGRNDYLGYGRINAYKALAKANGNPAIPQNLMLSGYTGESEPIISWSASSSPDADSYEVWRSINQTGGPPGSFTKIATVSVTTYTDYGLRAGSGAWKVYYKIKAKDVVNLVSGFSGMLTISASGFFKADPGMLSEKPLACSLGEAYPNPFNPSTTIRYGLPNRSHVTLTVFNTLGQQIATIVDGEEEAGYHEVSFNASGMASGVYLYRLSAENLVQVRRMVVMK